MLLLGIGLALAQAAHPGDGCMSCSHLEIDQRSIRPALSVEWKPSQFGVAFSASGAGHWAHATITDNGLTRDIVANMSVRWVAAQGTYYIDVAPKVRVRLAAGVAYVKASFVEQGTYNGSTVYNGAEVYHMTRTSEVRPAVGAGIELGLNSHWSVLADVQHIPHAVCSYWTDSVSLTTAGVSIRFAF